MLSKPSPTQQPQPKSQDVWLRPDPEAKSNAQEYLIYMLPGNPSIMTYYTPFLTTLFNSLTKSGVSAHVGGYTPPGFGLTTNQHIRSGNSPASLDEQVEYAEELIKVAMREQVGNEKVKVILVAHSAGTYMILQILKRCAEQKGSLINVNILGGILLCPAIANLAESKAGKAMNVRPLITFLSNLTSS
jgi:pimeloyl-ACP methyl ester carboxylesterase